MTVARKQAVIRDQWDETAFSSTTELLPALGQVSESLSDTHWTGDELVNDVFSLLHKAAPRLSESVDPAFRVNRMIAGELADADSTTRLRECTQGDATGSGLALLSMRD